MLLKLIVQISGAFYHSKKRPDLAFILLIVFFTYTPVKAQVSGSAAVALPVVGVHYGGAFSGGDLAARYGYFNRVGFTAGYKLKSNWSFGIESDFWFSDNVRLTGLFDHLVDDAGNITNDLGMPASVLVYPRGVHANAYVGRLFPLNQSNRNSGILVQLSGGYMLHRLRIETNDNVVPQIELDYKKGYDRLTTGFNNSLVTLFSTTAALPASTLASISNKASPTTAAPSILTSPMSPSPPPAASTSKPASVSAGTSLFIRQSRGSIIIINKCNDRSAIVKIFPHNYRNL